MTAALKNQLRLSLGPIQFHWSREKMLAFYRSMANTSIDIVYLGETVCSKRRSLRHSDWLDIAERLQDAGKEVLFSTLALVEAGSELGYIRKLCENDGFQVEANDMAAVQLLAGRTRFVGGATLNIQNQLALAKLIDLGLTRWVAPVEMTKSVLEAIYAHLPAQVESEILAWGRMPLAYSARCYTARARNLTKDNCGNCCIDYEDGLMVSTRESEEFLVINGIQTMSARTACLVRELFAAESTADVVRISPQFTGTEAIIDTFDSLRQGLQQTDAALGALATHAALGICNGYWHGGAGMTATEAPESSP